MCVVVPTYTSRRRTAVSFIVFRFCFLVVVAFWGLLHHVPTKGKIGLTAFTHIHNMCHRNWHFSRAAHSRQTKINGSFPPRCVAPSSHGHFVSPLLGLSPAYKSSFQHQKAEGKPNNPQEFFHIFLLLPPSLMSSEGPYGRQGFQSNPSGYGSYGGGYSAPQYGQGYGAPGPSYSTPAPGSGGYSGIPSPGYGEYQVGYISFWQ
jgi:hypothetical protein